MSIFGALRSGVTGLFSQSQAIGMIADNIANVNTVGFKAVRPRFSTLVTVQATPTLHSPGGVQSKVFHEIDQQGLLQPSDSATDIAIAGNGFFAVTDKADGTGNVMFTRAGSFRADKDGNLVNAGGLFLMGWPVVNDVVQQTNVLSAFSIVNSANLTASPQETTEIDIGANLPSTSATNDAFNLGVQVFDKQGGQHTVTLTFTKTATTNEWDLTATVTSASFLDPDSNDDATTGDDALIAGTTSTRIGTVTFNTNGTLASLASDSTAGDIATVNADGEFVFELDHDNTLATGTADDRVSITLNLGTAGASDGLSQFEGAFVPDIIEQNGKQFGSLAGVTITPDGTTTALFDNGETRDIYQVPLITFNNPNGLQELTGNVFVETTESGVAVAHEAGTGGAGDIAPGSLETSTVDLADEFTRMIVTQRAFSASTKIITTADEMLDELTRVIR